jgi:conjugal transfer pilus assembly protein TraF
MKIKFKFVPIIFAIAIAIAMAASASAQTDKTVHLDDAYGDAFTNYKPYVIQGEKDKEKPKAQPKIITQLTKPEQENKEQTVNVDWLIKNYPLIEKRAIDNPTEANISAYLYTKRIVLDKAARFQQIHTKVVNEDPILNENNRIPYASTGAQSIRNADYLAQQQAVKELSSVGGLVAFVDGSCRFCAQQLPILSTLQNNFGIETLVVSIDGKRPKGYTGPMVTDNGLFKKLDLKLTPSVVFVPKPKGYTDDKDPNSYLVISQGFYTADEMVKLIAFAGHSTKLLTSETMRDLNVWTRGVASNQDLQALKLDPSKPETFREKLQPLLLKQYQ